MSLAILTLLLRREIVVLMLEYLRLYVDKYVVLWFALYGFLLSKVQVIRSVLLLGGRREILHFLLCRALLPILFRSSLATGYHSSLDELGAFLIV